MIKYAKIFSKMADSSEKLRVLRRLEIAFILGNFPSFCIKPLQVKCFDHILQGNDVVAVLPTGFGKSLLFLIVVCPLNAIIEDQLKVTKDIGITADVLQISRHDKEVAESLFEPNLEGSCSSAMPTIDERDKLQRPNDKFLNGDIPLFSAHPVALLCDEGRDLMDSSVFKRNVVACVVDEAHCVQMW